VWQLDHPSPLAQEVGGVSGTAQQSDVNADLIGFTWTSGTGIDYTVAETWSVSPGYVVCRHVGSELTFIRPASVVRRVKMLEAA
jgi:hypothetical protein